MSQPVFSLSSWPRAIVHVDGDAFFTSCEEAIHPELRGKPLITGSERGIVACASYAAKQRDIKRGVSLHEARKTCPGLIVLPSDYETYSLFSRRMFDIMRRFTPDVEEYSIDEAFADITGMRRVLRSSYEEMVLKMKKEIERELGITVSAGLSITKGLAKIASKHRKPSGLTVIKSRDIAGYLCNLPVEKIWGIGNATSNYLAKMGPLCSGICAIAGDNGTGKIYQARCESLAGTARNIGLSGHGRGEKFLRFHQQNKNFRTTNFRCHVSVCSSHT